MLASTWLFREFGRKPKDGTNEIAKIISTETIFFKKLKRLTPYVLLSKIIPFTILIPLIIELNVVRKLS